MKKNINIFSKGYENKTNYSSLVKSKTNNNLKIIKTKKKQESLPNNFDLIDEFSNNNEINKNPIKSYEDVITKNLFIDEIKNRANYKNLFVNNSTLSYYKRITCVNWFMLITVEFNLREECFYLMINIFDRYIEKISNQKKILRKNEHKLIVITCAFIAAKYEEIYPPELEDFARLTCEGVQKIDILNMETDILEKLDYELHIISQLVFLNKFYYDLKTELSPIILYGAQFILDLCLFEPEFCELKPSCEAAVSLFLAKKFLFNKNNVWNGKCNYVTGYKDVEIKKNIKIPLETLKKFFNNDFVENYENITLYRKYSNQQYMNVVEIFRKKFTSNI